MKNLSTTVLTALLGLSLAACGNNTTPHDGGGTPGDSGGTGHDSGGMDMDSGGTPDDVVMPMDDCPSAHDCASCTAMGSCGWCANSNSCHGGATDGPTDMACSGTQWSWLGSSCPGFDSGVDCTAFTDCASCTGGANCGWCGTAHSCHAGTDMGATDGTCMGTDWSWTSDMCAGGGGDAGGGGG